MQEIMVRIEMRDFDAWLKTHNEYTPQRQSYGITSGPVYRDIANPNAALFHIQVESLDRAMEWFGSETFKQAGKTATVTGRQFYLIEKLILTQKY
jgi:uncharacterized protein YciI